MNNGVKQCKQCKPTTNDPVTIPTDGIEAPQAQLLGTLSNWQVLHRCIRSYGQCLHSQLWTVSAAPSAVSTCDHQVFGQLPGKNTSITTYYNMLQASQWSKHFFEATNMGFQETGAVVAAQARSS